MLISPSHKGEGGALLRNMKSWVLPKIGHFEKRGGLPLLRATKLFQNVPGGVTLDGQKCVFVHFLATQKEIGVCFASKVTDLCMLT